jgi:hypothetical protein
MDKLHRKKAISSKKKEKKTENKIRIVKKIRGGGPFDLRTNLQQYHNFVAREFQNNKNNENTIYKNIKKRIIRQINYSLHDKSENKMFQTNLFYIYEKDKIVSIGAIGKRAVEWNEKNYLYLVYLLSKIKRNRGGINAIYHLLIRVPEKDVAGIFLCSEPDSIEFYKKLGFIQDKKHDEAFTLDKTQENIQRLKEMIESKGSITTEFHSTYPNNIITIEK